VVTSLRRASPASRPQPLRGGLRPALTPAPGTARVPTQEPGPPRDPINPTNPQQPLDTAPLLQGCRSRALCEYAERARTRAQIICPRRSSRRATVRPPDRRFGVPPCRRYDLSRRDLRVARHRFGILFRSRRLLQRGLLLSDGGSDDESGADNVRKRIVHFGGVVRGRGSCSRVPERRVFGPARCGRRLGGRGTRARFGRRWR
jgi:hypothetical protein